MRVYEKRTTNCKADEDQSSVQQTSHTALAAALSQGSHVLCAVECRVGSVGSINSYGAARTASVKRAINSPKQTPNPRRMSSSADRLDSPLKVRDEPAAARTSLCTVQPCIRQAQRE